MKIGVWIFFVSAFIYLTNCNSSATLYVNKTITNYDSSLLLHTSQQKVVIRPHISSGITIDTSQKFQRIEGFGYTLTGGSAMLIMTKISEDQRNSLLHKIFGKGNGSLGVNYLRISLGPSDLDEQIFSYCEDGDTTLDSFNASYDSLYLLPLLKMIKSINPELQMMASPWSAPAWMKDNGRNKGGSLKRDHYALYAQYIVKYLTFMKNEGLEINTMTIQNEPENPHNTPSMIMSAEEQRVFIREFIGPLIKQTGLMCALVIYDHNCDHPEYPLHVLSDSLVRNQVEGTAFHLYAGDISTLGLLNTKYPSHKIYFTEQWTSSQGVFGEDLMWHAQNVVIGSMLHGAVAVMEWNLASDQHFQPHTSEGGCTKCKGAILVNTESKSWTKNVSWYIIGQASSFIPQGSIRIGLEGDTEGNKIAFLTPNNTIVLLVVNSDHVPKSFNFNFNDFSIPLSVDAKSFVSYEWKASNLN